MVAKGPGNVSASESVRTPFKGPFIELGSPQNVRRMDRADVIATTHDPSAIAD
jgi:hypothetical protein